MTVSACLIDANGPAGVRLAVKSAAGMASAVQGTGNTAHADARPLHAMAQATTQLDSIVVEYCVISHHQRGIWRTSGDIRATRCQFFDNSEYGILNDGADDVDARLNCWGHPSGPSGVGPGQGDAVSEHVLYYPWLANGVEIASSSRPDPTAYNNARKIVRDECPPFYKVVYTDGYGVWIVMTSDPIHGPWSDPVEIWPVDLIHHSDHPAITIELNDPGAAGKPYSTLHLVWSEHIPDETAPGEIYYVGSDDGGFTWSAPQNLSNSPDVPSEHPSIAADGTNVVHVAWDESATLAPDIFYVNNSVDGWTEPLLISPSSLADIYPAIASNYQYYYSTMPPFTPDDRVHIAWTTFAPSPTGGGSPWIAYRSYDPIWGWIPPLDSVPEDATGGVGGAFTSIIAYPSAFEVGRAAAVVWHKPYSMEEPPATASDIWFNERTSGIWGAPRPVWAWIPDVYPSRYASLTIQVGPTSDTLWTAWEEWDVPIAGRSEIYSCYSTDFGNTWTFYLNLSQTTWDLSLYPSLAYQKGATFKGFYDLAWTEIPMFGGQQPASYVYYIGATALEDSIYAGVPDQIEGLGLKAGVAPELLVVCSPNPVRSEARFLVSGLENGATSSPAGSSPIRISIYDIRGRLVRCLKSEQSASVGGRAGGNASAGSGAERNANGIQVAAWDVRDAAGNPAAPGVYFYRVTSGRARTAGSIVVLK